jgi:hypothetical protein
MKVSFNAERRKSIMKRTLHSMLCLMAVLLITCLPFTGYAETGSDQTVHDFLGVSFTTATLAELEQALQSTYDVALTNNISIQCNTESPIEMFGYNLSVLVDFNEDFVGIQRILMYPAGRNIWADDDEMLIGMLQQDFADYVALENTIIEQYGEPDIRFFHTDDTSDSFPYNTPFMFAGGQWDADLMMNVCRKGNGFMAYSVWGNIVLNHWVIWVPEDSPKKSKSYLRLYYYNRPAMTGITPDDIVEYPPAINP